MDTMTLRSGVTVLANNRKGDVYPKTYANRTQALRVANAMNEATPAERWSLYHPGRPWYVARVWENGTFLPPKPKEPAEAWLAKYDEKTAAGVSNHDAGICPCSCHCGTSCDHKTCPCHDCTVARGELPTEGAL